MQQRVMNKAHSVYILTNVVNGKKYVGITSLDPEQRWGNGNGYKSTTYIGHAIRKYGWENFEKEIVAEKVSAIEAQKLEIELISKYNTTNKDCGYNIQPGGNLSNLGVKLSDSTRKKMSESRIGENNGFYGKTHSPELREKLRKIGQERCGEKHPMFGKLHTEETKKKISESRKGKYKGADISNSEAVICLSNSKIYESMSLAELDNESCFFNGRLNDKHKIYMTGKDGDNYFGLIWMKYKEYIKYTPEEIKNMVDDFKYSHDFRIVCLNNHTVYNSSTVVEQVFGLSYLSRNNVRRACNSENHNYLKNENGDCYLWMYYKEYIQIYDESSLVFYQAA